MKRILNICRRFSTKASYAQGQEPEPKVREYFYFIDHQGMLFLDDSKMKNFTSCFKEHQFLRFFFSRLRGNNTGRYTADFPYLSICGAERNFIRCDDYPFVFTHVFARLEDNLHKEYMAYGHAGEALSVPFEPEKIFMLPATGRVYHPAPERAGAIGLVRSQLAIEFSKHFSFENGEKEPPTRFHWEGKTYTLDTDWYRQIIKLRIV